MSPKRTKRSKAFSFAFSHSDANIRFRDLKPTNSHFLGDRVWPSNHSWRSFNTDSSGSERATEIFTRIVPTRTISFLTYARDSSVISQRDFLSATKPSVRRVAILFSLLNMERSGQRPRSLQYPQISRNVRVQLYDSSGRITTVESLMANLPRLSSAASILFFCLATTPAPFAILQI